MSRLGEGSVGGAVEQHDQNYLNPLMRSEFVHSLDNIYGCPMVLDLTRRVPGFPGPALELKDKGSKFELVAEIPSIEFTDIELKLSGGILWIFGKRLKKVEQKDDVVFSREPAFACFERAIELPPGIDLDRITATARSGELSVHLPKYRAAKQPERNIPIGN